MSPIFLRFPPKGIAFACLLTFLSLNISAKEVIVTSPDGKAVIKLNYSKSLILSVDYNNQQVMAPSAVSMNIAEYPDAFRNPTRSKVITRKVNSEIIPVVAEKRSRIPDVYNEADIWFKGNFGIR